MNSNARNILLRNSIFGWIAVGTGLLLLIPLIAMQVTTEVAWSGMDFVVMGLLLFVCASGFVIIVRKLSPRRRLLVGAAFVAAFLYLWAELAVGIFTDWGS